METNKVNVKIYGQEYVIAGDKSREEILLKSIIKKEN